MELYHHGIKGQRWGIRRFQNEDGSLTSAGERRYYNTMTGNIIEISKPKNKLHYKSSEIVESRKMLEEYEKKRNDVQKALDDLEEARYDIFDKNLDKYDDMWDDDFEEYFSKTPEYKKLSKKYDEAINARINVLNGRSLEEVSHAASRKTGKERAKQILVGGATVVGSAAGMALLYGLDKKYGSGKKWN